MWENCVVTQSGITLLSKLEAIELSGAKYGMSTVPVASLMSQKSVTSPGATLNITQFKNTNEGFEVVIRVDNKGANQEYTIKQVGIYAREKGAEGDGILFAIMQDEVGNRIPAESEIPDFSLQIKMYFAISNGVEISAVIDSSILISRGEAEELIDDAVNAVNAELNNHTKNKDNPHAVTKSQVGLGNVPNVTTNDQTPTYTEAADNAELKSGEKLSTAFGKIAKTVKSLIAHLADKVTHITSGERTAWNGKADKIVLGGSTFNPSNGTVTVTNAAVQKAVTPAAPTSGQVAVFDGTAGQLKSSGFTIAASVPADAKFTDTNTTYGNMTGATASAAGKAGLVPAPAAGKQTSFLRGDGTWVVPTDTNTAKASSTATVGSASGWSAGSLPTKGADIAADDITAWSAGTAASASVSKGVLTITNGTVPSLSFTARSIPNVTAVGSLPSLTVTNTTVVTGVST